MGPSFCAKSVAGTVLHKIVVLTQLPQETISLKQCVSIDGYLHVWMTFQLKFSFWCLLPWHFFGLAHQRLDMARAICRRCLELRDSSPPTGDDHWLTVLLCVTWRRELERFAYEFADLSVLPFLHRMVARFKFALTSERWVEALHAISKHIASSAHNIGVVHIAFHSVLEPLRRWLGNDPAALSALANAGLLVTNPFACVEKMGLRGHSRVQDLLGTAVKAGTYAHMNQKHRHDLTEIIYHVDAATLNRNQPDPLPFEPPAPPGDGGPPGQTLQILIF